MAPKDTDPYEYSEGKWLRNDLAQQEARHISFDFDALCRRVVKFCPGADSILDYEKKEGGFNRVFIFTTNNGKKVAAKLPFSHAGPRRLTTQSEIATIEFVRKHSRIPTPTIYDWSDDRTNTIGSEYIIMEHAPGISLHFKWAAMTTDQRLECIKNICQLLGSIDDIHFPAYGSLYITGHQPEFVLSLQEDDQFCVGPHVATRYWDCNVGDRRFYDRVPPNRGPWKDLPTWSDGLIDAGISRVPFHDSDRERRPRYFGTPSQHLQLLHDGRLLLTTLSKDSRISAVANPILSHPDLNKRNIFVDNDDPTKVTSFIDWQSTGLDPAFWVVATRPDFATLPDHPDELMNEDVKVYARAFDTCTAFYSARLALAQSLDARLSRPFQYPHRTWNDGVAAFRHDLIMTSKEWRNLGFGEKCPITSLDADKFPTHEIEYRHFVAAQNLRKQVADYLTISSDGWVPQEAWNTVEPQHRELYQDAVQSILSAENSDDDDPVKSEEDLKAIWPFDL